MAELTPVPDLPPEEPLTADLAKLQAVGVIGLDGAGIRPSYKDEAMGSVPQGTSLTEGIPLTNFEMNQISANSDDIINNPQDPPIEFKLPDGTPYPISHLQLLPEGSQPVRPSKSPLAIKRRNEEIYYQLADIVHVDHKYRVFDLAGKQMTEEQIDKLLADGRADMIRRRRVGDFS